MCTLIVHKNKYLHYITFIFLLLLISIITFDSAFKFEVLKRDKDKYKGVAITLNDQINSDYWYDKNLPKIKKLGASLEVVTYVFVNDENDSYPQNDPLLDEKLDLLFNKCKQYNVKVSIIKPHIVTRMLGDSFNRATYVPNNKKAFFEKWKEIMASYSKICLKYNIPILSITCETAFLTNKSYLRYWKRIIKSIKNENSSLKVTIALSKPEFDREISNYEKGYPSINQLLDYVSINFYPIVIRERLNKKILDDNAFLINNNQYGYFEAINKAANYFHKKIIVTEVGATSRSNINSPFINPINLNKDSAIDHRDQNVWLKNILTTLMKNKSVSGVFVWNLNYPFDFLDSPTAKSIKKIYK
ncbi:hypothetical protein BpJC7_16840 [Weizmannia acidilactici]|uniref:Arabinogalactan endo-beta-1,4-galactanase n=1 Tax=Weizmannia acidilactici TaxID=2607726 RepID=A0A5J4JFC0_9BACI|nr:glycosyl hydrolase 53 family protein [Weizmannia acidilactici]GER70381.1 hypothetical protein BpJC7_16840 [Weizmannia acidilactici]